MEEELKKYAEEFKSKIGKLNEIYTDVEKKVKMISDIPTVKERKELSFSNGIKAVERLSDNSIRLIFDNETDQKKYFDTNF